MYIGCKHQLLQSKEIWNNTLLFPSYLFFFFFFKWLHPWHMEIPRPETAPTADPLTHSDGLHLHSNPSYCSQVLNPLPQWELLLLLLMS